MPADLLQDYESELARILRLRPVNEEGTDARRIVRVVYRPSFHPDCCVTIVDGPASILIVRSVRRSVWHFINARRTPWDFDLPHQWVEPACSEEVLLLTDSDMEMLSAVFETPVGEESRGNKVMIDGMSVRGEAWTAGHEAQRFAAKSPLRNGSGVERISVALLDLALQHARWDASIEALNAVMGYVR